MASERPLYGDLNSNPQESTSEDRKERDNVTRRAANIQKLKEAVIKLAGSAPNKPLSETQKSTVGECLDEFLFDLHTPDHPPYSQMIERAIRELNKDGRGCLEVSISNFIRKEYDDLPWSHFTLLKHHLGELCDSGSIIRTNSQQYLLAGTDATLTFGKNFKRRRSRKEQDSERDKRDIGRESLHQCLEAEAKKYPPGNEDAKQIDEGNDLERPPGFESVAFEETSNLPVSCSESRNHELQEVKSVAASRSKQGQTKIRIKIPAVKLSSFKELHPPQKIIDSSSCPAGSSLLHLQSPEQAISDTSKQQKVKSLTNKGSEHEVHSVQAALPSCTEELHPSVCSNLDKQYQAHKFPELGALCIEESSLTSHTQYRHRSRWYKKLLNIKQSQPDQNHQAPVKSSQLTIKHAIPGLQVKKNERQQKVSLPPSSSDQHELKNFSSLQTHPKHPPEKRVSQKLSSSKLLRPWLLISPPHSQREQQQQQKGKPERGIITNDKDMSFPNDHPAGEQHTSRHGRSGKSRN